MFSTYLSHFHLLVLLYLIQYNFIILTCISPFLSSILSCISTLKGIFIAFANLTPHFYILFFFSHVFKSPISFKKHIKYTYFIFWSNDVNIWYILVLFCCVWFLQTLTPRPCLLMHSMIIFNGWILELSLNSNWRRFALEKISIYSCRLPGDITKLAWM